MNIELTKNNHMIVGYNGVAWARRRSLYDKFFIDYGKVTKVPESFRSASIEAAKEISVFCKKIKKRPLVLYSGGIDSEFIVAAFLASGEDFSVAHIEYLPDLNAHESKYVTSFSKRYNLDLKLFQVDVAYFLKDDQTLIEAVKDNAHIIECQLLTSITPKIKDQYYPISDHPGVMLHRENTNLSSPSQWYWKDYEHLTAYYFHCLNNSIHACPSFYHWSPEIILAFLLDPTIRNLVEGKNYGKITNRTTMPSLYQETFPEYEMPSRPKFNGFEYFSKNNTREITRKLNQKTYYDRHSGQRYEYNELLKRLGYHGN